MSQESGFHQHSMSPVSADGVVRCHCDQPAVLLTSRTDKNPNRKFYKCANNKEDSKCNLFAWQDELDVHVQTSTPPSSPLKRSLDSRSQLSTPRSSPLPPSSSFTMPPSSSPDTSLGSPAKKARFSDSQPLFSQPTLGTNGTSSIRREDSESNPFLDRNNTTLPSTSIFSQSANTTPTVSQSQSQPDSPSKNISSDEIQNQGFAYVQSVFRQVSKLEKREKASEKKAERLQILYEAEKQRTAELTKQNGELEDRVAQLERQLAKLET